MGRRSEPEVVVVTGASAGVGRAVAHAFAKRGARVGLVARGERGLEGARREVESFGGEGLPLPTDVAEPQQVEAAAQAVEERFGPIDVWVNDAMATVFAPFLETTDEEFKRATDVTYLGGVYGTRAALKRMVPRDRGTVVQVGSALAYRAIPLQAPYCGAKHALRGFTDSVRTELLHQGSRVWITHNPRLAHLEWSFDDAVQQAGKLLPTLCETEAASAVGAWIRAEAHCEVTLRELELQPEPRYATADTLDSPQHRGRDVTPIADATVSRSANGGLRGR